MTTKYNLVMPLHMIIILTDISFNCAATIAYDKNTAQLMIFILQDIFLVMGVIVLLITFSSTFVFRAGLIEVLAKEFWFTLLISSCYLVSSIVLHVLSLKDRWNVKKYTWPTHLHAVYLTQRTLSVVYYFCYKRSSLWLSNPIYHKDSEWLREQIRERF
ncbi:unnamed protein product [Bursaphelenchus xylophilus]|uniref:Transmembrane protein 138 n=1 Tax=Bursaphelenchus xylophilus TaxID=6326 RepID=A0A1I7SWF8_BURXY|nr:unnamed protein product [Bursaphelenchus xylophilus]CAG9099349.1 unnamed protein product [Bursaphelenchus xylophilus]